MINCVSVLGQRGCSSGYSNLASWSAWIAIALCPSSAIPGIGCSEPRGFPARRPVGSCVPHGNARRRRPWQWRCCCHFHRTGTPSRGPGDRRCVLFQSQRPVHPRGDEHCGGRIGIRGLHARPGADAGVRGAFNEVSPSLYRTESHGHGEGEHGTATPVPTCPRSFCSAAASQVALRISRGLALGPEFQVTAALYSGPRSPRRRGRPPPSTRRRSEVDVVVAAFDRAQRSPRFAFIYLLPLLVADGTAMALCFASCGELAAVYLLTRLAARVEVVAAHGAGALTVFRCSRSGYGKVPAATGDDCVCAPRLRDARCIHHCESYLSHARA